MISKKQLRERILASGAVSAGFADAEEVPEEENSLLSAWINAGHNAGMEWISRHQSLRRNPENVLPGVKSIISVAYSYAPAVRENTFSRRPYVARYAYNSDYHISIRMRLAEALSELPEGSFRICIDSAPLPERYWAVKAGVGFIGDNGALIVPDTGPEVFLAEILTTAHFEPDSPLSRECLHCGACRNACPTGALLPDSSVDCRRCISYLTIEHRGHWSDPLALDAMNTAQGKKTLFGCDCCISVCPLINSSVYSVLPMSPVPQYPFGLSENNLRKSFPSSPLLRAKREGLLRNFRNTDSTSSDLSPENKPMR